MAEALFGRTKREILALFFGRPQQELYLRQIARETKAGIGAVQRELKKLVDAGLLIRIESRDQILYSANRSSPVYAELQSLLTKTAGIADVLRRALRPIVKQHDIEVAFVYGSVAEGRQSAASDIDLIVVGDLMLAHLLPAMRKAQEKLGREINPTVFDRIEFASNATVASGLVARVLAKPRIMIVGNDDDLETVAGKRLDRRASDVAGRYRAHERAIGSLRFTVGASGETIDFLDLARRKRKLGAVWRGRRDVIEGGGGDVDGGGQVAG